jgi:hypothetical protein
MSDEKTSGAKSTPRLCERCGSWLPPQKRGRPRRWCSQQCRQSAYEDRHGLESWKDKQPKVTDLSDVVEEVQSRAAKRERARHAAPKTPSRTHSAGDCVRTVCGNQDYLGIVIDTVTDQVLADRILDDDAGKFLANRVMYLIQALGLLPDAPDPDRQWVWVPPAYRW